MCSAKIQPMERTWPEIWSELRTAAAPPLRGIGLLLLAVVRFIMALWVVMAIVRVIAG